MTMSALLRFRIKMGLIAALAVSIYLAAALLAFAQESNEQVLLKIDSILGVDNGPTTPTVFTTTKPYKILRIMNYHWNYGKGAPGGKIGLVRSDGLKFGPWSVTTQPGQGGVPNAYWWATPNAVIPPGAYRVTDSSPGTWAQNEETGGRGISHVFGTTNPKDSGTAPSAETGASTTLKATTTTLKSEADESDDASTLFSLPVIGGLAALLLGLLAVANLGCKKIKAGSQSKTDTPEKLKETPDEEADPPDEESTEEQQEDDEHSTVVLELTYPVGRSPKVFTNGWVFGARCIVDAGTPNERDLSETVEWSGSGDFEPALGMRCRPSFGGEGANSITLGVTVDGERTERSFSVDTVSPSRYANTGAQAYCPADAHGCPACPHPAAGHVTGGSSQVLISGLPAVRKGDSGTHTVFVCCGPNTFVVTGGDPEVLIDGRPAAMIGDQTDHCGGIGYLR